MKLRKQRARREVSLDEDFQADGDMLSMEVTDWAPNPEQLYRASELRDILIKTRRPILRAVFVLQDLEGLSTDQTAEVLNLSQSGVKSRLWRARLQLRERLNKYFGKSAESARVDSTFYESLARAVSHSHRLVADQLAKGFALDNPLNSNGCSNLTLQREQNSRCNVHNRLNAT
jgi:hypothetical protein